MQSADLTLRLPSSMQLPAPEAPLESFRREEVLSWEVDPDSETVRFLSLVVGDPGALGDLAEDLESVHRYDITSIDADTFYGYVEMDLRAADATLLGTFDVPGLVVVPPMVYTGRENVHVTVLGEPEAMSGLLERAPDDVDVEVTRVGEHQRRSETLAGRLTARQFEALEVARDAGYYEIPRSGELATVAEELECSESAASTLLRSAEGELVDAALRR
ncbi:bacterio-opsin activator HTH domain-containing protein [Natronococcus amylolyticus DSM 10524]|uniref:Bacterio-opsin activator HTH domain-containing protein n=1 Tax=Natronococcus amylolyticus DSM 10524 TaxID=1227497 RepID=L9XBX8_9EURY|nr:helix-turn-helix domain-containing protein [Natronococcus amylolyticus]ELY59132.1 bacterio-opsin activator HTH domain-containing protein [Natronococcus amylolyticus DSM 10524]